MMALKIITSKLHQSNMLLGCDIFSTAVGVHRDVFIFPVIMTLLGIHKPFTYLDVLEDRVKESQEAVRVAQQICSSGLLDTQRLAFSISQSCWHLLQRL